MNYGKTFFGKHLIIKLRYKLTQQSLTAIQFAFPDLEIIPSLPITDNPDASFFKLQGCLRGAEYQDFEKMMRIAQARTKISEANFAIKQANKAIDKELTYASTEDFNLNLMT